MTKSSSQRFEEFGRKVDQKVATAMPHLEDDVKKVIAYLNNEVVPDVRANSIKALRVATEQLNKLAEKWERHQAGQKQAGQK